MCERSSKLSSLERKEEKKLELSYKKMIKRDNELLIS